MNIKDIIINRSSYKHRIEVESECWIKIIVTTHDNVEHTFYDWNIESDLWKKRFKDGISIPSSLNKTKVKSPLHTIIEDGIFPNTINFEVSHIE